jgi:hypothetical protein
MSVGRFLSLKTFGVTLLIAVALVAFNLTRPPLETATQAAFLGWYSGASRYLESQPDALTPSRRITAHVKIVRAPQGTEESDWVLPANTLEIGGRENQEQRSRLARVLQLIKESQVYGKLDYLKPASPETSYISIIVSEGQNTAEGAPPDAAAVGKDGEAQESVFTATVPLKDVESSIQLQNLIKLLEVFTATPAPSQEINPTQL